MAVALALNRVEVLDDENSALPLRLHLFLPLFLNCPLSLHYPSFLTRDISDVSSVFAEIINVIREEMEGPGSLSGYRSIWHALRLRHHVHVPRNLVAKK